MGEVENPNLKVERHESGQLRRGNSFSRSTVFEAKS
jgi:hypothetical protein